MIQNSKSQTLQMVLQHHIQWWFVRVELMAHHQFPPKSLIVDTVVLVNYRRKPLQCCAQRRNQSEMSFKKENTKRRQGKCTRAVASTRCCLVSCDSTTPREESQSIGAGHFCSTVRQATGSNFMTKQVCTWDQNFRRFVKSIVGNFNFNVQHTHESHIVQLDLKESGVHASLHRVMRGKCTMQLKIKKQKK